MSELMMGADEKFVREHWAHVRSWVRDLDSYGTDQFNVALYFDEKDAEHHSGDYFQRWQEDNDCKGFNEVWSSAAEFTRSRLEEIRRLESDIAHMQERFADPFEDGWGDDEERSEHYESPKYEDGICDWLFNGKNIPADGDIRQFAKESYRTASIIARLQAALEQLKRGMTAGG